MIRWYPTIRAKSNFLTISASLCILSVPGKKSLLSSFSVGFQGFGQLGFDLPVTEIGGTWKSDHHRIRGGGEVIFVGSKIFPDKALDPISDNGLADLLAHRDPDSRPSKVIFLYEEEKIGTLAAPAAVRNRQEFRPPQETIGLGK